MNKSLLLSLFLFFTILATGATKPAQYQITGQVLEESTGKGIPYATITLLTDSGKVLSKLCSEASGKFTVSTNEKGAFKLVFTAVGFNEVKLTGKIEELKTDVGILQMKEGVALQELAVTAQKPLIKVDVDKIAYSVDADPDAKTSNTLEMLRKVPLLSVDGDENVTLNGQSNFKVLVNGKTSSMMSKNFKEVIKSLPASSIKDIEVITNPPSKYDAEGIGGIINIITLKKTLNGYNGSVNAGVDNYGSANAGVYLSGKANKVGFSGRYSINQNRSPQNSGNSYTENYLPTMENRYKIISSNKSSSGGFSQNFSGEASYDVDSLNLISMSFWGYLGNNYNEGTSTTEMLNKTNVRTSSFDQTNESKYSYGNISGNIDYQKSYKKPDKSLTLSYKLDNNPHTSNSLSEIGNTFNYDSYTQRSKSNQFTREQTLQFDYYDPISKEHQIECGIKGIYRQNSSNSDYFRTDPITGELTYSVDRSNEMDYNQSIVGLYGGYVLKLKKFTVKSGLRGELTWNNAESRSKTDTAFTSNLQNIVPYVTLNYKLKPTETLKLSYTQRLNRPGIWYLNPYRNQNNDLYVYYGNPNLVSEISHSFEAGYNYFAPKFNFSLTGTSSFTNNSIEQIIFIDTKNVQNTTYDNIGKNTRAGLNTYISYRPNAKFNISFNGGANYSYLEAFSMNRQLKNDGFSFRGNLNSRLALWKDAAVTGSMSYNSPYISLQGTGSSNYYYNIGFSQYFIKRKLMLSLSAINPFTKYQVYGYERRSEDFYNSSEFFRQSRNFRLNLTYNFGKMEGGVKKVRRGIQNDDVKSGGGTGN